MKIKINLELEAEELESLTGLFAEFFASVMLTSNPARLAITVNVTDSDNEDDELQECEDCLENVEFVTIEDGDFGYTTVVCENCGEDVTELFHECYEPDEDAEFEIWRDLNDEYGGV